MYYDNTTVKHFLGIDPSINSTGLAIITETSTTTIRKTLTIKPNKKNTKYDRMLETVKKTKRFFLDHTKEGRAITTCIEGPSTLSAGMHDDLGQIRGMLKLTITDLFSLTPIQVPPTTLKKFASKGTANKATMVSAAKIAGWNILDKNNDEADAAHLAMIAQAITMFKKLKLTRKQLEVLAILGVKLN